MWQENTPVEQYKLNEQVVYVKREDLYGQSPAPPLAKLRGARLYIEKLKKNGVSKIGVFDTRISKAGQGVSVICKELGLQCICAFPKLVGETGLSIQHQIAETQGAQLMPMRGGRTAVLYAQFRNKMEDLGYYPMPLGLVCPETVHAVAKVAFETVAKLRDTIGQEVKTVVLSTGTGTIATGVHLGTNMFDIKVIGVSCGMSLAEQMNRIRKMSYLCNRTMNYDKFELQHSGFAYYDKADTTGCPFPTSPYYDMKAWIWLGKNIEKIKQPVAFWNIGV